MINPFAFLLSLETYAGDSKISSTFFFCQIEDTLFLKSIELRLSFTSMWVLQKEEMIRKDVVERSTEERSE